MDKVEFYLRLAKAHLAQCDEELKACAEIMVKISKYKKLPPSSQRIDWSTAMDYIIGRKELPIK